MGGLAGGWVGTCLALCSYGTCRCRCSSSKGFYQPREREVTSNSFGIAHLHRAFPRRSLQEWGGVGKKKIKAGTRGQPSRRGQTGAKGRSCIARGDVDANNSGEAQGSFRSTATVSVHVRDRLNMYALCRRLTLICMWPSLLCSSA